MGKSWKIIELNGISSGKCSHSYGKSSCFMEKPTISMAMEGKCCYKLIMMFENIYCYGLIGESSN